MEDYPQDNAAVLKADKRNMLLTNKDPHLSHLFEHSGPHTPNRVTNENLTQSSVEVDGSYAEEGNDNDYQLFNAQGGSFMPGLPPESNQLTLDVNERLAAYNNRNVPAKTGTVDGNNNTQIEASEATTNVTSRQATGRHPLKQRLFLEMVQTGNAKEPLKQLQSENGAASVNSVVWSDDSSSLKQGGLLERKFHPGNLNIPPNSLEGKCVNENKVGKVNAQLLSPPPDHYNMQLLAHSAQLQQEQLEGFPQGSSSAALQRLAKLRQNEQEQVEMKQGSKIIHPKSSNSPFHIVEKEYPRQATPVKHVQQQSLAPAQTAIIALPVSSNNLAQASVKLGNQCSAYGGWSTSDRGTPDFIRGHVRDLSFGSQDSPILSLHSGDAKSKVNLPTNLPKHLDMISTTPMHSVPQPELKSPLDHPEHQLDRQRNRFFSTDPGIAGAGDHHNMDDEGPLNERDKKAAAALGELLESEKSTPIHGNLALKLTPDQNFHAQQLASSSSGALRLMQMQQEMFRNTPPPAYDHALPPELQEHATTSFMVRPFLRIDDSSMKQQLVVTSGQFMMPFHQLKSSNASQPPALVESQTNLVLCPSEVVQSHMMSDTAVVSHDRIQPDSVPVNAVLSGQVTPHMPLSTSLSSHSEVRREAMSSPKAVTQPRVRRTSSSSSTSSRRKSDGSLTCHLCGHSFRSTPALNGHMRVHSSSDKKNKEERHIRSSSSDHQTKSTTSIRNSNSPSVFHDARKSVHGLQSGASMVIRPDPGLPIQQQSQQYVPELPTQQLQNRQHNGLLTMASAACFLKTESSGVDYPPQAPVLPQAYVVPHTVLFQQPSVVNVFNSNFPESQDVQKSEMTQGLETQNVNYSQIYAAPLQQSIPFGNLGFLPNMGQVPQTIIPPDSFYQVNQQPTPVVADTERESVLENQAVYMNQASVDADKQAVFMVPQEDSYANQYDSQQLVDTNSLSQLASIAVARREQNLPPEAALSSEYAADFSQSDMATTVADTATAPNIGWMSTDVSQVAPQDCIQQQELYQDAMAAETSPIRSGHDPFILPVSVPIQQGHHITQYDSNTNATSRREATVTWKDNPATQNHSLTAFSSYDDTLMQEALNVANPSKILPNSMMGGTPPTGTFSGVRPFRQRHHSEGSHLIKSSSNSILKRILHGAVSPGTYPGASKPPEVYTTNSSTHQNVPPGPLDPAINNTSLENNAEIPIASLMNSKKTEEFWAEPKPIQRRIRRRRHSADCRLNLKSGPLTNNRQLHQSISPIKKPSTIRSDVRIRHRPPPLVIPSSVSTFAPGSSFHQNIYQSHLHHCRRPSGDSVSSISGIIDKIPPYTPPPMLSPVRAGSGLYCTTPATPFFNRQKSVEGAIPTIIEEDETIDDNDEELVRSSDPKINIGARFQAVIPEMCAKDTAKQCKHQADKVWTSDAAKLTDDAFKHIEQFMELSCSAVVPFGGANKEFALDCLAQSGGDILEAARHLVTRKNNHSSSEKQLKNYTGAGKTWTSDEVKRFDCAMLEHRKDFFVISKAVKTRNTQECVERYYHIVKRHRRRVRPPRRYREQESDNIMTALGDSPGEKVKIESLTSASSSEDEANMKKQVAVGLGKYFRNTPELADVTGTGYSSHRSPLSESCVTHLGTGKQIKTHTARVQLQRLGSPSPAASPSSIVSNDDQPAQLFTCPVCGKSFAKVKSRNAHMKTHGKQAQEKRRQKEEEAAARRREMANRHRVPQPAPMHPAFVHPTAPRNSAALFQQHTTLSQQQPTIYGTAAVWK